MKHCPNAFIAAIITCGVLLACIPLTETVNSAPSMGEVINSDTPLAIAADSPAPNSDFTILGSNSTISDIKQTTSEITFTVTGPTGTTGYVWCEIAENLIPHQDTSKNVKVLLDGTQINYMYTFDEGAWQLFFDYNHSTHQVTISLLPEKATIFGIDQLTFVAGFVVICVVLGTAIVVWRRKQKVNMPKATP
jgi:hypothetical protein